MKKTLFLIFCITFFIFSCSPTHIEDPPSERGKVDKAPGSKRKVDDAPESDRQDDDRLTCIRPGYTVHGFGCPEEDSTSTYSEPEEEYGYTTPAHPVDILFVLNAGGHMDYYLEGEFKTRFNNFIPTLDKNNVDWRILVTNADYSSSGRKMNGAAMNLEGEQNILNSKILDRSVNDYQNIFMYSITREPNKKAEIQSDKCFWSCDAESRPLRALKSSFHKNQYLTRQEARFIAIIVSNRNEVIEGSKSIRAEEITEEFQSVYSGTDKQLSVLGVIIRPEDEGCYQDSLSRARGDSWPGWGFHQKKGTRGFSISNIVQQIGGATISICKRDYSVLADIIVQLSSQ